MRALIVALSLVLLCSGQQPAYDLVITGGRIVDGSGNSHVAQGITTEIMGEGWTAAPSNERTRAGMESRAAGPWM